MRLTLNGRDTRLSVLLAYASSTYANAHAQAPRRLRIECHRLWWFVARPTLRPDQSCELRRDGLPASEFRAAPARTERAARRRTARRPSPADPAVRPDGSGAPPARHAPEPRPRRRS